MVVILRTCNKGALSIIWPGVSYDLVGIFSIDNGDGSEYVTFKMNLRFLNFVAFIPIHPSSQGALLPVSTERGRAWERGCFQSTEKCQMLANFPELISWESHSSLEGERKIRRSLFTSSIKREIRHFHVVIAQ